MLAKLVALRTRQTIFLLLLIAGVAFLGLLHLHLQNPGMVESEGPGETETETAGILEYYKYRASQMKDSSGTIPEGAQMNALNQRAAMAQQQRRAPQVAGISNLTWKSVGPGNVGGRIRSVLPINATTVFVGGVSGGIWKTTNCCSTSTTWSVVNDFMANLSVATMVYSPTNNSIMYAGTGEGFFNGDAVRGAGIFKSTDGGTTWTQLASTNNSNFYYVNRLAISPNGVNMLAATRNGIYHSTNGGTTWTQRLSGTWYDVKFDPINGNNAVAGAFGASWYTTNGGAAGSWATATFTSTVGGRVEVAYAPSNPSIVYASVDQNSSELWRSTDGGHNYSLVNSGTNYLGTQGWYDNAVWVKPDDPTFVVVAGIDMYKSTNSGTTLTQISRWQSSWGYLPTPSPHADHHALVSVPGSNTALLNGNDGGIYYTSDIATAGNDPPEYNNGWVYMNNTLGITQFYGVAGNVNGVFYGGSQDNGTTRFTTGGGSNAWTFAYGGDGGKSIADPTDSNYFYNEYVYGKVHRSSDGGATTTYIDGEYWNGGAWVCRATPNSIPDACNSLGSFIAPILLDPNNANRLFVGLRDLWVTNDARTPSVWNSSTGGPSWASIKAAVGTADMTAIAVAPSNSNVIWVGYDDGRIDMTTNGTSGSPTWTQVDTNIGANNPGTMIGSIAIDKNNSSIVYVGFTGFGPNRIWRTANAGTNWTDITSNLPQAPIYAVAINPYNSAYLYIGTEIGIFASADTGTTWNVPGGSMNGDGPANVATFDLQWLGGGNSTGNSALLAGTHGRGAYTANTQTATAVTLEAVSAKPVDNWGIVLGMLGAGVVGAGAFVFKKRLQLRK
ncbi:MAG: hypothetical protein HZB51_03260 [Chloroflexi bacterium]|nr:hypothetical protein [Chloroflexota bacterium]